MNLINQLIKDTPQQQVANYESYLHLHLKLLMTNINKARVQDITHVHVRKNKCMSRCYSRNFLATRPEDDRLLDTVEEIRTCKQKCKEEKQAVRQYLDDINYYSELKLTGCLRKCQGGERSKEYNQCYWGCLNKLDRRYKKYWVEQRQLVESKFASPV